MTVADHLTGGCEASHDRPSACERDHNPAVSRQGLRPLGAAGRRELRLPGILSDEYETVAGYALAQLGRLPRVTDRFDVGRFRFEIVDMDGNRIDKLLITRHPEERSDEGS